MSLFVKDKHFYKQFFFLTASIALQNVIAFSVNLADNLMLGAYSETALSGVALVNQIQFLLQMITMGVGEGIIVFASQYWGKQETGPIQKITAIGMRIGVIMAFGMFCAAFFASRFCLGLFTGEQAVIAEGVKYLQIICFSYVLFAITNILLAALRSVETVKIGFLVSLSTLCINVCLNYVLIYGNFGAPRMGVRGAAVATLTARCVELLIMLVYIGFADKKIKLRPRHFLRLSAPLLADYAKGGTPVILSNAMWGVAMAVQTAILGHLSQTVIAANSIATTVFQIVSVICYGAASAAAVLIGKTVGSGSSLEKIKGYTKTLQALFVAIGLATGLTLFFAKDAILQFYAVSPETKQLAAWFITILSVSVCGTSYQVACLTGIVRGGGDTKFVLYNDALFMWLIVIPSAALSAYVFHFRPWWCSFA